MSRYKLTGLGIENFRIFKDYKFFNLKPITILTGTNSSGKSTLGKALLLLKHSFEDNKLNELILNSPSINLGSVNSIMPYSVEENEPKFILEIIDKESSDSYRLSLEYSKVRLKTFSVSKNDNLIAQATINNNSNILNFSSSYFYYPDDIISVYTEDDIFQNDIHLVDEIKADALSFVRKTDALHNLTSIGAIMPYDKKSNTISEYLMLCCEEINSIGEGEEFTADYTINRNYYLDEVLSENLKEKVVNRDILKLSLNTLINNELNLKDYYSFDFFEVFSSINNSAIEYNISDLVVSRLKYPTVYNSLICKDIHAEYSVFRTLTQLYQQLLYIWIVQKLKLVKRSSEFFLEKSSDVRMPKDAEYNFIKIIKGDDWGELVRVEIFVDNNWVPLSSLGYGTANIILKILQMIGHNNLLILEEPEVNLHPSLQSKLADLIVQTTDLTCNKEMINPSDRLNVHNTATHTIIGTSINIENSFKIVETHSEYLIRRLQYLVANEESPLSSEDIQIYYFNNPLEEEFDEDNQIIDIKINPSGSLTNNFGKGFMDEADNIALELYLLQYK